MTQEEKQKLIGIYTNGLDLTDHQKDCIQYLVNEVVREVKSKCSSMVFDLANDISNLGRG